MSFYIRECEAPHDFFTDNTYHIPGKVAHFQQVEYGSGMVKAVGYKKEGRGFET
jgi:hypothetical protein